MTKVVASLPYEELGRNLHKWSHPGSPRPRALVFVHGFTGDLHETWTNPAAVSLMELVVRDEQLSDFDVFTFGYTSGVWRSAPRIETIVQQFKNVIAGPVKGYHVVLCGHSMGGLVCMKHIITELSQGRTMPVVGLILYGTPIEGSALVNVTKLMLGFVALKFWVLKLVHKYVFTSGSQLTNLAVGSDFLNALRADWARHVVNGGDPNLPIDQRATIPVRVVSGNEDFIVSERSAKSYFGDMDWHPVQYDHRKMVKPSDHQHASYQALQGFAIGCRYSDTPAIRTRLKELSERILAQRNGKLITHWKYRLECFGATHQTETPWDATLKETGFGITRIKECEYQTLISRKPYTIAFAFGTIAEQDSWNGNPAYVHFVRTDYLSMADRERLSGAIDKVFGQNDAEATWNAVFRNLHIKLAAPARSEWIDLKAGTAIINDRAISREYSLPSPDCPLFDREGVIAMSFDTVRPGETNDISVEFPWLTYFFEGKVTIHGATDYVYTVGHGVQEEKFKNTRDESGNRSTVGFSIADLVLPGSFIRVRWLEKREKELQK